MTLSARVNGFLADDLGQRWEPIDLRGPHKL